jgi:hypothetical protein
MLASLALLWSVHLDLSDTPHLIKHYFRLNHLTPHQLKLVWLALSLTLVLCWEDERVILVRLWLELLIGCKHKNYVLLASLMLGTAIVISLVKLGGWLDVVPILILTGLFLTTLLVLTSDPKAHSIPSSSSVQMLKPSTRIKKK